MKRQEFIVTPVGHVRTDRGQYVIEILGQYRPALAGLEGFGHIHVLWWADRADTPEQRGCTVCSKPYTRGPDTVGIFATRSPQHPNPVAVTTVAVLSVDRDRGIIRVPYLDADDGTPVIDIKPYHPSTERVRDVVVPVWCSHWPQWCEDSGSFDWEKEFTF